MSFTQSATQVIVLISVISFLGLGPSYFLKIIWNESFLSKSWVMHVTSPSHIQDSCSFFVCYLEQQQPVELESTRHFLQAFVPPLTKYSYPHFSLACVQFTLFYFPYLYLQTSTSWKNLVLVFRKACKYLFLLPYKIHITTFNNNTILPILFSQTRVVPS